MFSQLFKPSHVLKLVLMMAPALGLAAGMLSAQRVALAQEMDPHNYMVFAGGTFIGNIDSLVFAPQELQVHQGDTVTWNFGGFHNIRFGSEVEPLVLVQEVNGVPTPIYNPAVALPTIESGGSFTGEGVNSGLPTGLDIPPWSLVINAEPGTYTYFCDVHAGMAGTITVVAPDTAIPSPMEAVQQGLNELRAFGIQGLGDLQVSIEGAQSMAVDGVANVMAGAGNEASVQQFFPFTTVITAGDTVTWSVADVTREIHTVSWPPIVGQDVGEVIEQEGGPPIITVGATLLPINENGATVGQGDPIQGIVTPGQPFSLVFSEPGVYPYVCNLHPGMQGTVVVMPAA